MGLQSMPRDTRCVWFEMLGRMWESNERGFLTINGKPMSDFAKANILGFGSNVDEYLHHERILESAGIFSKRESDGAIFCRKILNDLELSKKRAEAGSKGGKKKWRFANTFAKANAIANAEYENEKEDATENKDDFKIPESLSNKVINLKINLIVLDLNEILGKNYKPTSKPTRDLIKARLKEGFTLEDFKTVHRKMLRAWAHDAKMCKYLRPGTLYRASKFEGYLNMVERDNRLTEHGWKAALVGQEWLKRQETENA